MFGITIATGAMHELAAESAVAYVSNQDGGISIIGLDTLTVIGELTGGGGTPRGIGVTDDGKHVLTANRNSGDLSVYSDSDWENAMPLHSIRTAKICSSQRRGQSS